MIHWGLGITLHHDPGVQTQSQQLLDFTAKYNLPRDHGFHTHTYFSTYRVHLRSADRWVTLIDNGRLTSLDNADVRALASRYGDPDRLLAEDWRPEIPGINAPGSYAADYAPNPWRTVKSVIDSVRGEYKEFVFGYRGRPIDTMNNTAWQAARKRVGLSQVRVHDLKHTFGRRLRAAGVSFEDRQDLLGHRSGRITTHYSAAELANLIEAANKVCEMGARKMPTTRDLEKRSACRGLGKRISC